MSRNPDLNRLPLSVTSFAQMIAQDKIYVDKTDLAGEIAGSNGPVFLSRPRRFGKSTLVNTFHELFAYGLGSFKGLKIDKQQLWHDPKTYKVLRFDFSPAKDPIEGKTFAQALRYRVYKAFKEHGFTLNPELDVVEAFEDAAGSFADQELVLLVDEYDAPLTQVMNDPIEFERRRKILSAFFLTLKTNIEKFRFIFITGVTRFSEVSIFSAFNNLDDISSNPLYGAITGYTQQELEHCFKDYLDYAADVLNRKYQTAKYDRELILKKLQEHYDGYSFDEDHQYEVYNPWSILKFLKYPGREFKSYWLETGGAAPALLVNFLDNYIERRLNETNVQAFLNLDFRRTADIDELSPVLTDIQKQDYPLTAIMYQAGYLTIKEACCGIVKIGIPNLEVKQAYAGIILHKLTQKPRTALRAVYLLSIRQALAQEDYQQLRQIINRYLNDFTPEAFLSFNEAAFRDVIKAFLVLMDFDAYSEYSTASGRCDLCLSTDDTLFVFEFKVTDDPAKAEVKLKEAADQIKSRKYCLRLAIQKVVPLAAVIVKERAKQGKAAPVRELALLEPV